MGSAHEAELAKTCLLKFAYAELTISELFLTWSNVVDLFCEHGINYISISGCWGVKQVIWVNLHSASGKLSKSG